MTNWTEVLTATVGPNATLIALAVLWLRGKLQAIEEMAGAITELRVRVDRLDATIDRVLPRTMPLPPAE